MARSKVVQQSTQEISRLRSELKQLQDLATSANGAFQNFRRNVQSTADSAAQFARRGRGASDILGLLSMQAASAATNLTNTGRASGSAAGMLGSLALNGRAAGAAMTTMNVALGTATVGTIALGVAVGAVIAALAGGVGALVIWGSKLRGIMEDTEAQIVRIQSAMQSQINDIHAANIAGVREYEKAITYASRTPFSVQEVTQSVAMLRSFQFNPFEKIGKGGRELIEVLGDMAGAMGVDVATAAWALNRAFVGEWEIMQNNFQVSARMIPQLKGVATGTEQYRKVILEHLAAMQRWTNGIDRARATIRGLMSNISDAFYIYQLSIAGVSESKSFLGSATLYDSVRVSIRKLYDAVSDRAPINDMMAAFDSGEKTFKAWLASAEKAGRVPAGFSEIKKVFTEIRDPIERQYELLRRGFPIDTLLDQGEKIRQEGRLFGQAWRIAWEIFIDPIFSAFSRGVHSMFEATEWFFEKIGLGAESLSKKQVGAADLAANAIGHSLTTVFGRSSAEAESLMAKHKDHLMAFASDTDAQLRKANLAALGFSEKRILAFAIMAEFVKLMILDIFGSIWDWLKSNFFGPLSAAFGSMFNDFVAGAEKFNMVQNLFDGFHSTLMAIGSVLAFVIKAVVGLVEGFAEGAKAAGIFDDLAAMFSSFGVVLKSAGKLIQFIFGKTTQNSMQSVGVHFGRIIAFGLSPMVKMLSLSIRLFSGIVEAVQILVTNVGSFVSQVSSIQSVGQAVDMFIVNPFRELIRLIGEAGRAMASLAPPDLRRAVSGTVNKATSNFQAATDSNLSIGDRARAALSILPGVNFTGKKHVGEWRVPGRPGEEQVAVLQAGEMVVPAKDRPSVEKLFNGPGAARSSSGPFPAMGRIAANFEDATVGNLTPKAGPARAGMSRFASVTGAGGRGGMAGVPAGGLIASTPKALNALEGATTATVSSDGTTVTIQVPGKAPVTVPARTVKASSVPFSGKFNVNGNRLTPASPSSQAPSPSAPSVGGGAPSAVNASINVNITVGSATPAGAKAIRSAGRDAAHQIMTKLKYA